MLSIGTPAPDFTLADEQGRTVSLASFRQERPVVLIFYPGDETPGCTAQLCAVRDDYQGFLETGAAVFGVNPGGAASHQRFAQRHKLPFPLLVDADKAVARAYAALLGIGPLSFVNRTVYVVGVDGRIVFARRGMPDPATVIAAIKAAQQPAS